MFNIIKAVFGGVMLFLGRDLSWLFSLGIGLLVGLKTTSLLSPDAPLWMQLALIVVVAAIAVLPHIVYPESSYIVTGFLFGGYILAEYGNTVLNAFFGASFQGSDWIIFFVGAVIGAAVLAFTKEWGIMFATALIGAFFAADVFKTLSPMEKNLLAGGLFVVGCIVQTLILGFEKNSDR